MERSVEGEATAAWEERAVSRSLEEARGRSARQVREIVASARAVVAETGGLDFTLQQVVTRAGVSLKTLYRFFRSKDELLLAILEEDNRYGAARLAEIIGAHAEPIDRLRAYVTGLFSFLVDNPRPYMMALVREGLRLADAASATAPFTDLLGGELAAAAAAGAVTPIAPERDTAAIFQFVRSQMHAALLGEPEVDPTETGRYVWRFVARALRIPEELEVTAEPT